MQVKKKIMKTYSTETIQPELKLLKDWQFANNGVEKKFVFQILSKH